MDGNWKTILSELKTIQTAIGNANNKNEPEIKSAYQRAPRHNFNSPAPAIMVKRLTLGIAKPWVLTPSATTPDSPIENKSNPALVNAIGRFIVVLQFCSD